MNDRIFELAKQADLIQWDSLPSGARTPDHESVVKAKKFAELIVRELVSLLQVDGSDFYHNEFNNYGCITVKYFVPGNPHLMCGEEVKAKFHDGMKGTGRFLLNEKFVEYIMKSHFGVEE